MLNYLLNRVLLTPGAKGGNLPARLARSGKLALCAAAMLAVATGCGSAPPPHAGAGPAQTSATPPRATVASSGPTANPSTNAIKSLLLQEGDTVKISFPGAANLDAVVIIRRDGKVTLPMVGEYDAASKTPATMETELKKLYSTLLVNSDVLVTVQSSAFIVYVTGSVNKPGKIVSERPLTVLEALIEAGIDNTKSNLRAVQVIRTDAAGHTEKVTLNLWKVLHSRNAEMPNFALRPYDIINVPEKFSFY